MGTQKTEEMPDALVFCEWGADHACVGSFAERQRAERSECRDLRSKRVQMGKKSIYYGSVSSLFFRCLIGVGFDT